MVKLHISPTQPSIITSISRTGTFSNPKPFEYQKSRFHSLSPCQEFQENNYMKWKKSPIFDYPAYTLHPDTPYYLSNSGLASISLCLVAKSKSRTSPRLGICEDQAITRKSLYQRPFELAILLLEPQNAPFQYSVAKTPGRCSFKLMVL